MVAATDGRYRLAKEGVLVYADSRGVTGMAHARLYEAVNQERVVIVGELQDNPGTPPLGAIDGIRGSLRGTWLGAGLSCRLLLYDVAGQTFSEISGTGSAPETEFVSILDVLGIMPELFNADEYTVAQLGGRDAAEFREQASRRNQERLTDVLTESSLGRSSVWKG